MGGYPSLIAMIQRDEVDCVVLNAHLLNLERLQALEEACRAREVDLLRLQVHLMRLPAVS